MPLTRTRPVSARDARMLAVVDRLIQEFEHLPVITVIRAVGSARVALREIGEPVTPDAVESLARARLVISHQPRLPRQSSSPDRVSATAGVA